MNTKKQIAEDFLKLISEGKVEEAFKNYAGEDFKHHNPYFKGGGKSLMKAMIKDAENNPEKELKVLRSLAEDELVAVHSQVKQNPKDVGFVLVHIFKFHSQKIIELWDLGQEIPDEIINENGML